MAKLRDCNFYYMSRACLDSSSVAFSPLVPSQSMPPTYKNVFLKGLGKRGIIRAYLLLLADCKGHAFDSDIR